MDTTEHCAKTTSSIVLKISPPLRPDTIQLSSIYFNYNDTTAAYAFAKITDTLNTMTDYHKLLVYGYTDNAGSLSYNQQLSDQRATFIAKKLAAMTNKNIIAKGLGLSDTNLPPGLQRRVDILLVK